MSSDTQDVMKAVAAVGNALKDLNAEQQQNVLSSVAVALGLKTSSTGGAAIREASDPGNSNAGLNPNAGAKRLALVEFVRQKQPATNAQAIAVFAAYRQEHDNFEHFSKDDLQAYFAKAKRAAPQNYSRDYGTAVKEGWIHDDGAKSYLTQSGEDAVAAGFGGKGKARGKAATKRSGKGKA
jgi:hypothetical protein